MTVRGLFRFPVTCTLRARSVVALTFMEVQPLLIACVGQAHASVCAGAPSIRRGFMCRRISRHARPGLRRRTRIGGAGCRITSRSPRRCCISRGRASSARECHGSRYGIKRARTGDEGNDRAASKRPEDVQTFPVCCKMQPQARFQALDAKKAHALLTVHRPSLAPYVVP